MNQSLIEKLMISKKIMDKHNEIGRGGSQSLGNSNYNEDYEVSKPSLQEFAPINASYNIPQEFLSEQQIAQPYLSEQSISSKNHNLGEPTQEMVMNSKLPDEIKKLMLEHPIQKPQQQTPTLSDDVIAAAARLMNTKPNGEQIQPKQQPKTLPKQNITESVNPNLKGLVKEAVREILQESGLLVESSQKSNETFSFRVGQHIFEGKVTKIKKVK
jgi:hypothetical protein